MNSVSVNLRGYYNNYVILHNFAWPGMDEFWARLVKTRSFFFSYYTSTNASAFRACFMP